MPLAVHDAAIATVRPSSIEVAPGSLVATIQAGIERAAKTGIKRILIAPGTYDERDLVATSGLTLSALSDGVTLTGSIEVSGASDMAISGLTFRGAAGGIAIDARYCRRVRIEHDVFAATGRAIVLDGTTDSVVADNLMIDTNHSAIEAMHGASGNRLSFNVIEGDRAPDTVGAIWLHGADDSTISGNRISGTVGAAISLMDFSPPGSTLTRNDRSVVVDNVLDHVDTGSTDSGAIYVLGRSQDATGIIVKANVIGATGSPGAHAVGLYLDDNASGVTSTGNIVAATETMSDAYEIHGGSNDIVSGNIFDLGRGRTSFGLFQRDEPDQMPKDSFRQLENDVVTGNIFTTQSVSPRKPGFADLTFGAGDVTIRGNDYWSFAGTGIDVAGTGARGDVAALYTPPAPHAARSLADHLSWNAVRIGFVPLSTSGRSSGADP